MEEREREKPVAREIMADYDFIVNYIFDLVLSTFVTDSSPGMKSTSGNCMALFCTDTLELMVKHFPFHMKINFD